MINKVLLKHSRKLWKIMQDITQTVAYKSGVKAAQLRVPIEQSGLKNLNPDSDRYDQFIAGYDSVEMDECECENLGSQCDACDDED